MRGGEIENDSPPLFFDHASFSGKAFGINGPGVQKFKEDL